MNKKNEASLGAILPDEYLVTVVGEVDGQRQEKTFRARLPGLRGTFQLLTWFASLALRLASSLSGLKLGEVGKAISEGEYDGISQSIVGLLTSLQPEELGFFLQVIFRLKPESEEDKATLDFILENLPTSAFLGLVKWILASDELKAILGNGKTVIEMGKGMFSSVAGKAVVGEKSSI